MTVPVVEDQINTPDCSPGAFIRQDQGITPFENRIGVQIVKAFESGYVAVRYLDPHIILAL